MDAKRVLKNKGLSGKKSGLYLAHKSFNFIIFQTPTNFTLEYKGVFKLEVHL